MGKGDDFQGRSDEFFAFTQVTKDADSFHGKPTVKSSNRLVFWILMGTCLVVGGVVWLLTEGLTLFLSLFR